MSEYGGKPEVDLRERAVVRLRKKGEFRSHLLAYVLVNAALVVIWAMTGAHFFWPAIPLFFITVGIFRHLRWHSWHRWGGRPWPGAGHPPSI
jgi:hypothetical protein